MSQKLETRKPLETTPVVNVRGEVGSMFKGMLLGSRQVDVAWGKASIYEFKVIDSTMTFQKKNAAGEYADVDVKVGATVAVFAGTRLQTALGQALVGQIITITYLGLGKRPKKGGNVPHEYNVEAE